MEHWKIKLNWSKSVHVLHTLRHKNSVQQLFIEGMAVPQAEAVKDIGLHLNESLNWRHHIRHKPTKKHHSLWNVSLEETPSSAYNPKYF